LSSTAAAVKGACPIKGVANVICFLLLHQYLKPKPAVYVTNVMEKQKVLKQYMEMLLTDREALRSVLAFCKKVKLDEKEFYDHFNSLEDMDKAVWEHIFEETEKALSKEDNYKNGSAREKVLFFYYTIAEVLKSYRSYVLFKRGNTPLTEAARNTDDLKRFKSKFEDWIKHVIDEGVETEEIANRQRLVDQYFRVFWVHFLFVLEFWIKDDSKGFEKTDAAIEKSVNLAFELIGKGPLDSALDFAKFIFQNQKNI
jgi:hypothetical protein